MVEYIMIGATTVQTCTAVMWRGLKVFNELSDGLRSFMKRKGYQRIEEFRGIALKYLTTVEELAEKEPMHGVVEEGLCSGCKICVGICQYDAIDLFADKAKIDPEKCDGCGLCLALCPTKAIELL